MKKCPIITLCGSTRFKSEFEKAQKELTLKGYIVISVGLFGHSGDDEVWEGMSEDTLTETKQMLDDMHKRKIDLAEAIYVVNPGGYIGSSTWSEICYAWMTEKDILSLDPIDEDEIAERVDRRIERAELLAWQNWDTAVHQGMQTNPDHIPSITYKREKLFDPWFAYDEQYNGEPLSGHGNGNERISPFEKYGNQKMAAFIEEVLASEG